MVKQQNPKSRILALALAAVLAVGTLVPTGGLVKSYADSGQDSGVVVEIKTAAELKEAAQNGADGSTLKIMNNINMENKSVSITNKSFTLDLNSMEVSNGGSSAITLIGSGSITVTDNSSAKTGRLTTSGPNNYTIGNTGTGSVVVSGGTVQALGAFSYAIYNSGVGPVTVSGGKVEATSASGGTILNSSTGKITISGADTVVTSKNTNATACTICLEMVPTSGDKIVLDIQGGTVSNTASPEGYAVYFQDTTVTATNVKDYYQVATTATVGKIYPFMPVAQITKSGTTTTYPALADAVKAAVSGDTIKVIADIDLGKTGVTIDGSKELKLDLNGKTVTSSGVIGVATIKLKDSASLTVTDTTSNKEGKLEATGAGAALHNDGTGSATVTGGTVRATGANGKAISLGRTTGAINVTGGTVEATDASGQAINSYGMGKITISGANTLVTSKNTTPAQGTIYFYSDPGFPSIILDIRGGTVSNTASPEGYSVYFYSEAVTTASVKNYYQAASTATVGKVYPALPASPSGGSSGGSSKSNWTPTTSGSTIDVAQGTLGLGTYNNYDQILVQGLEKLAAQSKGKTVNFDRVENGKVLYRVKVDPAKLATVLKADLSLNVHYVQNDAAVLEVTNRFAKYYSNNMVAVTYDQAKPLSVNAEFAAKLDLSKLNSKTLYFYSYNPTTNSYTRIAAPNYFVDVNGYSHITAPLGGSILITDKPLTAK